MNSVWGRQYSSPPPRLGGLGGSTAGIVIPSVNIAGGVLSGAAMAAWGTLAATGIGAAVAGVTIALTAIFNRKGPQQKVATTHIVDAIEPELRKNLDGYMSGPRTRSSQQQALANFDAGWNYVLQNCGKQEMGNPGQNCINDRKPGGKWDWFSYYRDPIANDPNVKEDEIVPGIDAVKEILVGDVLGGNNSWVLPVGGALLLVGLLMLGGSR